METGEYMVDFSLTNDQTDLINLAIKFVKNEISPFSAKHDKERTFPLDIYQKLYELGLMNPRLPQDVSGAGLGLFDECLLTEEFGYGCTGITSTMIGTSTALDTIINYGSSEQKNKFLKPFTEKLMFASFCLTEPDYGSDITSLTTSAKQEDNSYVINGSKKLITNAPYSNIFIVFATTDPSKKRHGITAFIVPKDTEGISIGKELAKMGQRASSSADVDFQNVKIPLENRIGKEGEGFIIALNTLNKTRVLIASAAIGLARSAMDYSLDYSLKRVQFDQPIANFEAIQIKLANMTQDITASRLLTWNAAMKLDKCEDASKESTYAKCFATDMAMKTAIEAVQIYGGYGYTKDYPIEKLMRDAKLLQIFGGVNEILKLNIAKSMIKSKK